MILVIAYPGRLKVKKVGFVYIFKKNKPQQQALFLILKISQNFVVDEAIRKEKKRFSINRPKQTISTIFGKWSKQI